MLTQAPAKVQPSEHCAVQLQPSRIHQLWDAIDRGADTAVIYQQLCNLDYAPDETPGPSARQQLDDFLDEFGTLADKVRTVQRLVDTQAHPFEALEAFMDAQKELAAIAISYCGIAEHFAQLRRENSAVIDQQLAA